MPETSPDAYSGRVVEERRFPPNALPELLDITKYLTI
jgi:hypothetical protein